MPSRQYNPTSTYVPSSATPNVSLHRTLILPYLPLLPNITHTLTLFSTMNINGFTTNFLHLQHKHNPISLNYQYLTSIKTLSPHITCLAVHHNLLYAASLNLINVFDLSSSHYTHINTFNESSGSGLKYLSSLIHTHCD